MNSLKCTFWVDEKEIEFWCSNWTCLFYKKYKILWIWGKLKFKWRHSTHLKIMNGNKANNEAQFNTKIALCGLSLKLSLPPLSLAGMQLPIWWIIILHSHNYDFPVIIIMLLLLSPQTFHRTDWTELIMGQKIYARE